MTQISIGGDAENYMDAPRLNVGGGAGGGGGGSFIASLLDLIGVNRQVAKGPKKAKEAADNPGGEDAGSIPPPPIPKVLTDVAMAFAPQSPPQISPVSNDSPASTWGQRWLQSNQPLLAFDPGPSSAFKP